MPLMLIMSMEKVHMSMLAMKQNGSKLFVINIINILTSIVLHIYTTLGKQHHHNLINYCTYFKLTFDQIPIILSYTC